MPIIPALGRLRKEDGDFKASLDYMKKSCPEVRKKKKFN
jgi:hypothetical protein